MPITRRAALAAPLAMLALSVAPGRAWGAPIRLKVGIMAGEDEAVWEVVADQAKAQDLLIHAVVFNDYPQPNEALEHGELDANAFQHKPYLDNQIATQGYHIVPVGYTAVWPIGLYSKTRASISAIPDGAVIAVPNDPSNSGRGLKLLEQAGLIRLRPDAGILATAEDITDNPKHVVIRELDAGIIGRAVPDLDAAVVNTDWALKSGLTLHERLASEPLANNPYRNFIAVRADRAKEPWVAGLVRSYQTETTKAALARIYKGTAQPAW